MEKKKIYFIISSILCIFLSALSIIGADSSREAMLNTVSNIPGELGERMATVYNNNMIFIIPAIICILLSGIILIIIFNDKLNSKKNTILGLSIAIFISSSNTFIALLSIINIIIAANIKSEKTKKEKKEIPQLKRYEAGTFGIIGAIVCFIIYFSQALIPDFNSYIISIIKYIIVLELIIFIFKDNLKRDIKIFKENYKEYINFVLPRILIMYLIYFIFSFITVFINKNMPVNQQQIEALPIWYTFPLAALLAPIVEEILFRGCIRRFIKNDTLFIVVSGFLFGILHTISEGSISGTLIMAIPYSILGAGFAYIYAKTNNITNNILCHSIHNTIVMLLQIILF